VSARLLLLTPFAPRLDAPFGGGRVMAELARRLAARQPTALVCLRGPDEPPVDEATRTACALVEEVARPSPAASPLARWRRRARLAIGHVRGRPMWATDWQLPAFATRVRQLTRSWAPDVVQIEAYVMAQYVPALAGCPASRILVEHDALPSLNERHSLVARMDALARRRFERWALRKVNAAVVFTERDRRAVAALNERVPIVTIPFGTHAPERALDPLGASPPTLLFVGTYLHPPNVDAAVRLASSILPALRARCPGIRLQIVGPVPPPEVQRLRAPDVEVTGWVPDVRPYLDRASVIVAPLQRGGGMRVKVLEALAAGKAVVASPRALEGLAVAPGAQCLVAETDQEFVDAIQRLLSDADVRAGLASRAREWALANLGWDRAIDAFDSLYERLAA
jgi:glycosyltransferase involved in cell wall biosynthesis